MRRKDLRTIILKREVVIEQFEKVHGDLYDYSLVDYKGGLTPVKIICKKHGVFEQTPHCHKKGSGCRKCSKKSPYAKPYKLETILKKFRGVHGDLYDYSKVEYKGTQYKVDIICKEHGSFSMSPTNHYRGSGCRKCSYKTRGPKGGNGKPFTKEEVINIFRKVHGDLYDYSLVDYKGSKEKVEITCKKHGPFWQLYNNHRKGSGCPECSKCLTPRIDYK